MNASPVSAADRTISGTALALAAALLYGASLPLSRLLFDYGSNPLTVGTLRYIALALCLAVWLRAMGHQHPPLSARQRIASVLVGVCFALISLGQLLAIERISVSLTTLLFYAYPAFTVVCVAAIERRRPRLRAVLGIAGASLGLVLVLGISDIDLHAVGIGLALLAAASATGSFLLIERMLGDADALRTTAVASVSATVVSMAALAIISEPQLPDSVPGFALLVGVMLMFSTAVVCTVAGVARAGSVRMALVLFLEPIVAIAIAVAALDESLTAAQWLGAVLVVTAVALSARR